MKGEESAFFRPPATVANTSIPIAISTTFNVPLFIFLCARKGYDESVLRLIKEKKVLQMHVADL